MGGRLIGESRHLPHTGEHEVRPDALQDVPKHGVTTNNPGKAEG